MADERMKILYLWKILEEETDEAHPLNASELADRMIQPAIWGGIPQQYGLLPGIASGVFDDSGDPNHAV